MYVLVFDIQNQISPQISKYKSDGPRCFKFFATTQSIQYIFKK